MCACVRACVCVCVVCVMQNVSKTKNLLSLERKKATESEIRTHIGNTLKN